jgi:cytochrome c2
VSGRRSRVVAAATHVALLAMLGDCGEHEPAAVHAIAGADAARGAAAMQRYGCGACHRIPGIPGARGLVGPPLDAYAQRALLAGQLPNTASNLVAWLVDPPRLIPDTGMPAMGVVEADARDMAAYLYGLRSGDVTSWPPDVLPDRPEYDDPDRVD